MGTKINYKGTEIKLSSKRQGVAYPWGEKYQKEHHRIFVRVGDLRTQFEFYCNTSEMKPQDLREAFYFFLGDGIAYKNANDIDDFQSEFGYEDVSECKKVYEGCKRAWYKWEDFGIDPYNLSNWMQEKYDL